MNRANLHWQSSPDADEIRTGINFVLDAIHSVPFSQVLDIDKIN